MLDTSPWLSEVTGNLGCKDSALFFLEKGWFRRDWTCYHSTEEKPNRMKRWSIRCPKFLPKAHVLLFLFLSLPMEINHIFIIITHWIQNYSFASSSKLSAKAKVSIKQVDHVQFSSPPKSYLHNKPILTPAPPSATCPSKTTTIMLFLYKTNTPESQNIKPFDLQMHGWGKHKNKLLSDVYKIYIWTLNCTTNLFSPLRCSFVATHDIKWQSPTPKAEIHSPSFSKSQEHPKSPWRIISM